MVERQRLVYVLAASHSGSTLLSMLLNLHPDVVTAGELKAVHLGDTERYRCSCHTLLKSCEFWRRVHDNMQAHGHEFEIWNANTHFAAIENSYIQRLTRPLVRGVWFERLRDAALWLSPTWRKAKPQFLSRSRDLVKSVAAAAGADVVVESSKVGLRLRYLLQVPELDIHVLRMVRDGRAVSLTYMQPGEFADAKSQDLRGGGAGGTQHEHLPMEAAAREWRRSNEEAESLLGQLRVPVTEVQYERLCDTPLETLNQVFRSLELAPLKTLEDFKAVPHHVIGNGMRLDERGVVERDDRWRSVLTKEQLRAFDAVAGALNQRYGYT